MNNSPLPASDKAEVKLNLEQFFSGVVAFAYILNAAIRIYTSFSSNHTVDLMLIWLVFIGLSPVIFFAISFALISRELTKTEKVFYSITAAIAASVVWDLLVSLMRWLSPTTAGNLRVYIVEVAGLLLTQIIVLAYLRKAKIW